MIEVRNLVKKYGAVPAVRDVSFTLPDGQVLGFLGPNGAGKTTVMKILTGFHFPGGGVALVNGVSVQEDPVAVKRMIGYLPEGVPLYGELTVTEYLAFIAEARLVPKENRQAAIDTALEQCGLTRMASRRIDTLSKGYRQRVGLAEAIVHDPPILILDEPTTGLDPNQIIEIRGLIKELGRRKTVILSTHILQEVEAVCTQVLILNAGRIAAQGSPSEIAANLRGGESWNLLLKAASPQSAAPAVSIEQSLAAFAAGFEGGMKITGVNEAAGGAVEATFVIRGGAASDSSENGERIFDWAVSLNLKILEMSRRKTSLEDIFVKLTGEAANEKQREK
ncbi:MAG: ATP-binding cassette domain-containing protein [Spirochaetaceae bacterium]|jgi:ABC-2 type transport system ATP-binding protein|nr:ATP-binding cassette domain-containing protein [Spirochaetaceae bacterium]